MFKWIPVDQVQIVHEVDYCVLRNGRLKDIAAFWPEKGWEGTQDEWITDDDPDYPVTHILNGEPLPDGPNARKDKPCPK